MHVIVHVFKRKKTLESADVSFFPIFSSANILAVEYTDVFFWGAGWSKPTYRFFGGAKSRDVYP